MLGFDGWLDPALALLVAVLAGGANAVAGGGSNISFPALVWLGLPPVVANATNAAGLWTGSLGAAWSYRHRLAGIGGRHPGLVLLALAGGGAGAILLVRLPPEWFASVAPWMVLSASALVALQPLLEVRVESLDAPRGFPARAAAVLAVLVVSLYGGYFGAGVGILVLVTLAFLGFYDLHDANALKNLLVAGIKGVALVYFIVRGVVDWPFAVVMIVGSTLGGWGAGHAAQRLPSEGLRWVVVTVGAGMGVLLLVTT